MQKICRLKWSLSKKLQAEVFLKLNKSLLIHKIIRNTSRRHQICNRMATHSRHI